MLTAAWWKQPLLHFFVLGGSLFAVDLARQAPAEGARGPILTAEVEAALDRAWLEKQGRPLDAEERAAVLQSWVENEALVREARRLGLDRGDAIIRRRLVQKMEFVLDSRVVVDDPDEATLEAWFGAHREDYGQPARVSLHHRFFSRSRRQAPAEAAQAALAALAQGAEADRGDPYAGPQVVRQTSLARLERDFGADFARAVEALPVGEWAGPVPSSYGVHIVFVDEHIPPAAGVLAERRAQVLADWRAEAVQLAQAEARAALVAAHSGSAP